jgi:hypothetical protein
MNPAIDGYGNVITTASADRGISANSGRVAASGGFYDTGRANPGIDTVRVSTQGRLLASALPSLILPTEENVARLAGELSNELGQFLSGAGISAEPPVDMNIDWSDGSIEIKGDRAESGRIEQLINDNQDLAGDIRNLAAIASHAAAMADSLKFQREYLASGDPEAVVARYAYPFGSGRSSSDISLSFDSDGVRVMTDGRSWVSSGD